MYIFFKMYKKIHYKGSFICTKLSHQNASKALKITGHRMFQNDYCIELKNPET